MDEASRPGTRPDRRRETDQQVAPTPDGETDQRVAPTAAGRRGGRAEGAAPGAVELPAGAESWLEVPLPRRARAWLPPHLELSVLAAVALGGAAGAPARLAMAQLIPTPVDGFPWATFVTNVLGSFALGALLTTLTATAPLRHLRPLLATGFLGAFTTFSTFAVEADLLAGGGHAGTALAYVGASLATGLAAAAAGMAAVRSAGSRLARRVPR